MSANYKILLVSLFLLLAIGTTYYFLDDRKQFLEIFWLLIAGIWYLLIFIAIYFVRLELDLVHQQPAFWAGEAWHFGYLITSTQFLDTLLQEKGPVTMKFGETLQGQSQRPSLSSHHTTSFIKYGCMVNVISQEILLEEIVQYFLFENPP